MGSQRIASKTSAATEYYHSDHLGSANIITDSNGAQIQRFEYRPFGSTYLAQGTSATNYKYTGKESDPTGLYYYGARYYDPEIGRFIQADTIVQSPSNPQTLNRYTYCNNNPINNVDPTGHSWSWKKFWNSVVSGIGAGVAFALTGNPVLAGMVGGAISGGLSGGGIQGILTGAVLGAGFGGIASIGPAFAMGALVAGAAYTVATQGLEGLGYMAGGIAGGIVGYAGASAISEAMYNSRVSPNLARERGLTQTVKENRVAGSLKTDQKPDYRVRLKTNYDIEGKAKSFDFIPEKEPAAYRQGKFAAGEWEGNFIKGVKWAPENPATTFGFAKEYGLPAENSGNPDWIVKGRVMGSYKTGAAPSSYNNPNNIGGATEIIPDNPDHVRLDWFHMP